MEIDNSRNLLIDADDTLWENNVYYERVIHQVLVLLRHNGVDVAGFRAHLDETERERIPVHGYGTVNFTHSLVETVKRYLPAEADLDLPSQVEQLSLSILHHPLEILDGVPETLAYLSLRHQLFLVTKGNRQEQSRKIRESNLQDYFHGIEILPEKNAQAYTQLLTHHEWEGANCWMIGNSPRSDINPALAAGMHAVYIPHPHTWTLEHEEPAVHPHLLELEKFSDLRRHF